MFHVKSQWVARIAVSKNKQPIVLGNLDAERDWGHAKDFVRAQHLILQQPNPDDYIIATGIKKSVRDILDIAFRHVGISDYTSHIIVDEEFKRPNELHSLHASSDKAKKILNWEPIISFESLITEMVEADVRRHENSFAK